MVNGHTIDVNLLLNKLWYNRYKKCLKIGKLSRVKDKILER